MTDFEPTDEFISYMLNNGIKDLQPKKFDTTKDILCDRIEIKFNKKHTNVILYNNDLPLCNSKIDSNILKGDSINITGPKIIYTFKLKENTGD